jgi:hypothetical protein
LLSTYLATRRGNCVTMPVLFAVIGRRLGLTLALAKAPHHLFVKVRDDDGSWINVEATAGGLKRDESYVRETHISGQALANGLYLRPMTSAGEVATLAGDVAAALERRGQFESAIRVTERMLAVDPRDVEAMVRLASLHARILDRDFHARWPNPADVPPDRHAEYRERSRSNTAWFAKAEALGWRQPSAEDEAAYLRGIARARDADETPATPPHAPSPADETPAARTPTGPTPQSGSESPPPPRESPAPSSTR